MAEQRTRAQQGGILLVEILFAIVILIVSVVWLLVAYQSAFSLVETSQQTNVALNDLRDMMERIKTTPFVNLQNDFPNGAPNGIVGGGTEKYSAVIGGYSLNNEQVTVTHQPNPTADPQELVVQVSWRNRGRTYQRQATTIRASRAS